MKTRRILAICLCLALACGLLCAGAESAGDEEDVLASFKLRYGSRNSRKVAITVDDCYKSAREYVIRDVELCREYQIHMTFFPLAYTGFLEEQYREIWQSVLDAGCEIGSHTYSHLKMGNRDSWGRISAMGKWQEALDKTLGYHYETRWLRPPYGSLSGSQADERAVTKSIRRYGYEHAVCWDISETKDLQKIMNPVQGGSILLFHAKKRDTGMIEKLIPELLNAGYELVTVSELFGFPPVETSDELYVYNKEDYRN